MKKAQDGNKVKVHYTGTLDDGTIFDSSVNRDPLEFTLGKGQLLKKFEEGVVGLAIGDSITIQIPAADGYGLHNEKLVAKVPLSHLPGDVNPEMGMKLQTQTTDGQPMTVTIVEMDEKNITVDANHELAGKDLNFDIELVEIAS